MAKSTLKTPKVYLLLLLLLVVSVKVSLAQSVPRPASSIRTALGLGYHNGFREEGYGLNYVLGYQKTLGETGRWRINPNLTYGGFTNYGSKDARDVFYRVSSLDCNIQYDVLRSEKWALVTNGGVFMSYVRGLIGTGGNAVQQQQSTHFFRMYYGGLASMAISYRPTKAKVSYDLRPLSLHLGSREFVWVYMMFGININLK
jgi:hypothetical protein